MRIIIAPDKFKGSLTSFEVCQAIAQGIGEVNGSAELLLFPFADGGDGFAAVMKYYLGTTTVGCASADPLGRKMNASYEWDKTTQTAIIEMAVASGMILLRPDEQDPLKTSTYGTGLLIKDAVKSGVKKIILGLGGSATNDAGTGILSALGFHFTDANGQELQASGENLLKIEKIILPGKMPDITFEIACDVQNKLYGPQGAAYVYARQKGASIDGIRLLDEGLKHFAVVLEKKTGAEVADTPGTGAAGGIGAGLMAFFDVHLRKGIDMVMEASTIKNKMKEADLLITGEGKIDEQTPTGKVVGELALLAREFKIPVVAFCGIAELNTQLFDQLGLQFIEPLVSASISKDQAIVNAREFLVQKAKNFFRHHFTS